MIKLISKIIYYYLISILSFFIKLLPRDKNVWIYGGLGGKFVDNSKYLFLYANTNFKDRKHIWLTSSVDDLRYLKRHGFLCYNKRSFYGIYYSLRAKVYIYSSSVEDISYLVLSSGAFLFNLWHGLPLKKIGRDNKLHAMYQITNSLERTLVSNYQLRLIGSNAVLCPAIYFNKVFISAFGLLDKSELCHAPYPRTLPFYWTCNQLNSYIKKFESDEMFDLISKFKFYKKIWIYMPTWRENNPNFIQDSILSLERLNEACSTNEILFLIKLHPNTKTTSLILDKSNILILNNKMDIYPILPYTNTLLTDYSSIFLDYYILKKKIVFYPFDLDDYLKCNREMYFRYKDIIKGDVVNTFDDLINYINSDYKFIINEEISEFFPGINFDLNLIEKYILKRLINPK